MRAALCLLVTACGAAAPAPTSSPRIASPAVIPRERPVFERFGYRVVDVHYLAYTGMAGEPPIQHTREPAATTARACMKRAAAELVAFLASDPPKLRRLLEIGGFTQDVVLRVDDYSDARYRYAELRDPRLLWADGVWTWDAILDDKGECRSPSPRAVEAALSNLLFKLDPDQTDDRTRPAKLEVTVREYGSERPLADVRVGIHERKVCPQWQDADACPAVARMSAVTDASGVARFDLPHTLWGVDEIKLDGYVNACPHSDQSETSITHYLDEDSHDGYLSPRTLRHHICRLARASALHVNSANAAIRIAKSLPPIRAWLAQHPEARIEASSEVTSWEVTGVVGDRWEWRVVIDAFDGSYYTNGP